MAPPTAKPPPPPPPVEETLAWEAQWGMRAAVAAVLAGLLTIASTIGYGLAVRGRPGVTLAQGLRDAAQPDPRHGLLERAVTFNDHHALALTLSQIGAALSAPIAAVALIYLFRAVRARRPGMGQGALIALAVGAVATFVGLLVAQIVSDVSVANFVSSADHSTKAAHDATFPNAAIAAGLVGFVGHLALGVGFVMVALNAMRVGLLSRFMGVLGIMAGVFYLPILPGLPVVQAFWLVAVGFLFLGRFPSGTPPAWETGRAEPWPTRQEMLEQQGKAKAGAPAKAATLPPPVDPVDSVAGRPEHPRSKKKKRRR